MDTRTASLTNQTSNKNEFAKFIRDLSSNLTNVKHLLEDYEISVTEKNKEKGKDKGNKGSKNKKNKPIKKKDLIIAQNKEKKYKALIQEDVMKVDYYMKNLKTPTHNPCFRKICPKPITFL